MIGILTPYREPNSPKMADNYSDCQCAFLEGRKGTQILYGILM